MDLVVASRRRPKFGRSRWWRSADSYPGMMRHYAHYGFKEFVIALGYKGEHIKKYFADYCSLGGDVLVDFNTRRIATNGDNLDWTVNLARNRDLDEYSGGRIKRLASHVADGTFMLTWGDGAFRTSTCTSF